MGRWRVKNSDKFQPKPRAKSPQDLTEFTVSFKYHRHGSISGSVKNSDKSPEITGNARYCWLSGELPAAPLSIYLRPPRHHFQSVGFAFLKRPLPVRLPRMAAPGAAHARFGWLVTTGTRCHARNTRTPAPRPLGAVARIPGGAWLLGSGLRSALPMLPLHLPHGIELGIARWRWFG